MDGNIGYQCTGRYPVRRRGDGSLPVPGWTDEYEWVGYVDFDDMPSLYNPERGYILTANQPVVGAQYPVFIGIDHALGYRAKRIDTLLSGLTAATVEDMQRIQVDNFDGSAAFLVPLLAEVDPATEAGAGVQRTLIEWAQSPEPFQMNADSAGAAAYAAVWRAILGGTFDDELPEDRRAGGNGRFFEAVRRLGQDDPWWDDVTTPEREDRSAILVAALERAAAELGASLGADPAEWRWGDLHTATFDNTTFGRSGIGIIEALFNRTASPDVGGGSAIVNATSWLAHEGYEVVAMPSFRMVVDLSDLRNSVATHTTGQSGHAFDRRYFDQNELWVAGGAHPMRWTRGQVIEDLLGTLTLVPAP